MAVIKCPHCGKYISSTLKDCTECGKPISDEEVIKLSDEGGVQPEPTQPHSKFRITARRIVIACFLTPFILTGGYLLIDDIKRANDLEQRAYDRLANTTDLLVYEDFMVRFPDSKYIDSVKVRYEQMKHEQAIFFAEAANGGRDDLQAFIDAHPTSPFRAVCERRIDTLDWFAAAEANTLESYQAYLTQHPNGAFNSDAVDARNRQQRLVVTAEETNILRSAVDNFLSAMSQSDVLRIDELTPGGINFCGVPESSGQNVVDYFQQQFKRDDVIGVHFQLGGASINKRSIPGTDALNYNFYSTASATINRSSLDSATVVNYKVTASFTPERRITSLTISQLQDTTE